MKLNILRITSLLIVLAAVCSSASARVLTYPLPAGESASTHWAVTADSKPVFVDTVRTNSGGSASFASFDMSGQITVCAVSTRPVQTVAILPASYAIKSQINGSSIVFHLDRPRNVTVEINGTLDSVLHVFGNPIDASVPRSNDPNLIYFGPGVHEVSTLDLKDNQTLYLAGGAIVRAIIPPDEVPINAHGWRGQKTYRDFLIATGAKNVTVCGHGLLDMGRLPWQARNTLLFDGCTNVKVEGITILSSSNWNIKVLRSEHVEINNVKVIAAGENSDGIDLCNTHDAEVNGGFFRVWDDEICIKTVFPPPCQPTSEIRVTGAVIWNEVAHALGIGCETRANVSNVTFQDCDIIHDLGICSLTTNISDSGTMSNIRFDNIRIADCRNKLAFCNIVKDYWSHDMDRGHVNGVTYKDISVSGTTLAPSVFAGYDNDHAINDVLFDNIRFKGQPIKSLDELKLSHNEFVHDVKITAR